MILFNSFIYLIVFFCNSLRDLCVSFGSFYWSEAMIQICYDGNNNKLFNPSWLRLTERIPTYTICKEFISYVLQEMRLFRHKGFLHSSLSCLYGAFSHILDMISFVFCNLQGPKHHYHIVLCK